MSHKNDLKGFDRVTRTNETTAAFRTFPLADVYEVEPESNEAIPSPDDVKEAKDWVDFNEK